MGVLFGGLRSNRLISISYNFVSLEIFMQNKIYVGNLSYSLGESSLRTAFAEFGEITDLAFPKDRVTGRPRGFAFITFNDASSAEAALKLDGQELSGRKV